MPLPVQKTPAKRDIRDLTVLLYGKNKYGKTEFCSKTDGALFLATEPGLNHLEVYQTPISTWDEMLQACAEISAGGHPFRTIIIDTVDNAYRMCCEHICRKHRIEHESDLGYGKGYALINNEFQRVLNKLALLPYGLFLVSHAQEREIETPRGKITRTVPTLPEKARKLVLGMVDLILYCALETTTGPDGRQVVRRVVHTKPSPTYDAGDRTGRLPEVLDLDYRAFVRAFETGPSGESGSSGTGGSASIVKPPPSTTAAAPAGSSGTAPAPAAPPASSTKPQTAATAANVKPSPATAAPQPAKPATTTTAK